MATAIHQMIQKAERGELPSAIIKLVSGWVVAGEVQPLQGYCMLLSDPVARDFNALTEAQRMQYALDMSRVGDALLATQNAYRINYETWGNSTPALHTHIVPRFMSEPDSLRVQIPRRAYDWESSRAFDLSLDAAWMAVVREYLTRFQAK
jgi:diadenosine tetraphosphate (Ap4A) HIT family hydrolase